MIRALVTAIVLLLWPMSESNAASPPTGGASPPACPNPNAEGSLVIAPSKCTITAGGRSYSFNGLSGDGVNYLIWDGSQNLPFPAIQMGRSSNSFWELTRYPTCGDVWRSFPAGHAEYGTSFGTLITPVFTDTTKTPPQSWRSLAELFAHVSSKDTLSIGAASAQGIKCWPEAGGIGAPLTINFAAGTKFADVTTSKGVFVMSAPNITLAGASNVNRVDIAGAVRIEPGNTGGVIRNAIFHDGCRNISTSGIMAGGHGGMVTLDNVEVYHCGDSNDYGQNHNVYFHAEQGQVDDNTCENINNLYSHDVWGAGWLLKLTVICSDSSHRAQGRVTNSILAVTELNGDLHAPIDFPCGGNHKVDHSVLEAKWQNGLGGNGWYFARFGEEFMQSYTPPYTSPNACASRVNVLDNMEFDHDIFINDNTLHSTSDAYVVVCTWRTKVGDCNNTPPNAVTCKITNSIIVNNYPIQPRFRPGSPCDEGGNTGCTPTGGNTSCTDANGNKWYDNRTAAAAGQGWSGNDFNGNPCCAWPWLPMRP